MINKKITLLVLLMVSAIMISIAQISDKSHKDSVLDIEFKKADFKIKGNGLNAAWENILEGNRYFNKKKYDEARHFYVLADNYNPDYSPLKHITGVCQFHLKQYSKAFDLLKQAYNLDSTTTNSLQFYLGATCQYLYQFDLAIYYLDNFCRIKNPGNANKFKKEAEKKLAECLFAKEMLLKKNNIELSNFGMVNTENSEYCPVYNHVDSVLYFSSMPFFNGNNIHRKENIFYWKQGMKEVSVIGDPFYNESMQGLSYISEDLKTMLFTFCEFKTGYGSCDIYISVFQNNKWSAPVNMGPEINSVGWESTGSISPDGKTVYFSKLVDNRTSIFTSNLSDDGKWSKIRNIGFPVNSGYDYQAPFIHFDGKTLYFSYNGENSIGGFDIYKSVLQDNGKWSSPQNLGFPINSPFNENRIWISPDGKFGFVSSDRSDGKGEFDIYKIIFNE